eukprot:46672-Alexandrium_andersonii.AAC.1
MPGTRALASCRARKHGLGALGAPGALGALPPSPGHRPRLSEASRPQTALPKAWNPWKSGPQTAP